METAELEEAISVPPHEMTLLIVDDDRPFLNRLSAAMQARGFLVSVADFVKTGLAAIAQTPRPSR